MRRFHRRSVIASRLKAFSSFSDNFSLSSGMKSGWKSLIGSWSSNAGSVTSDTDASTYPMSYIKASRTSFTATAQPTPGTGIAFWISDAGSWYAAVAHDSQTSYDCNCSTCYGSCYCDSCKTCQSSSTSCQTCCNVYSCSGAGYSNTIRSGSSCYDRTTGIYQGEALCTSSSSCNCQTTYTYFSCGGYYSCNPYSCNCATCNGVEHHLQMIRKEPGADGLSSVTLTAQPAAISVETNGSSIILKAYSDVQMTTQLGDSITATADLQVRPATTLVGIVKVPSHNQGSTISAFNITT